MKKLHNKSILIIDDDAGMLRALDKVLTGEGATVTCADCAADAMEILTARQKRMDLVITDLRMPFVTGLTVLYAIHEIFPALPVLAQRWVSTHRLPRAQPTNCFVPSAWPPHAAVQVSASGILYLAKQSRDGTNRHKRGD